jgi:DNA-binding NtrC family response regulator
LIIDDEELVATTLARVLKREHDVTVSTSADAALEQMQAQDFDAVLCDLMMPGVSGMDLFQSLAGRDAELARRVIFMTGGAFVPKVRSFLEGVPNPCFDKPLDLPRLRQALRRCVVGRAAYGATD